MEAAMYDPVEQQTFAEPTIGDHCAALKHELGLSGNIPEVVSGACRALGVEETGSLVSRAKKCREVLAGGNGDVAAGNVVVAHGTTLTVVDVVAAPTVVDVVAPAIAATVVDVVAPPVVGVVAPPAASRNHYVQDVQVFDGAGLVQRPEDAAPAAAPALGRVPQGPAPRVALELRAERGRREAEHLGSTREIQRRFNVSVPRARVPKKASTLRDRSER